MTNIFSAKRPDGVVVITFDRPASAVNSFNRATMEELDSILDSLKEDSSVKGLVLVSAKPGSFIVGADIPEIDALQDSNDPLAIKAAVELGLQVFSKIPELPFKTVAALNGHTLGGGGELALWCKHRIASPDLSIGWPEPLLGFPQGWGGNVRLPRLIGLNAALGYLTRGSSLNAKQALEAGIIDEIAESDRLLERACEIALGAKPKARPLNIKSALMRNLVESHSPGRWYLRRQWTKGVKRATRDLYPAPLKIVEIAAAAMEDEKKALSLETRRFVSLALTDVSKNLVDLFMAKERAKKTNLDTEPLEIEKAAVIGLGVMGAPIAYLIAAAGFRVAVKEQNQELLDNGMASIRALVDKAVSAGKMTPQKAAETMSRIEPTTDFADLADCQLVIEAIIERLDAKQKLLADCEKAIPGAFIFASNTSGKRIADIAAHAKNPGMVVGWHFFNPPWKLEGTEVIRGENTSDTAVATIQTFAGKVGKFAVPCLDRNGFAVNRLLTPYMRRALKLVEKGVPVREIDKAMIVGLGAPMGPLELLDQVGIAVGAEVIRTLSDTFGNRLSPPDIVLGIEALGLRGRKFGRGMYVYAEGQKPVVNPDVEGLYDVPEHKMRWESIQELLVLSMINEAAFAMQEGLVESAEELDLLMVMCTGLLPHAGGILKYADSRGIKTLVANLENLALVDPDYAPCPLLVQMADRNESFYGRFPRIARKQAAVIS